MISPEYEKISEQPLMSIEEILSVCYSAELLQAGDNNAINSVVCNTNDIRRRDTLFCAVRGGGAFYGNQPGENYQFDFHKYIDKAIEARVGSILLEKVETSFPPEINVIKVPNVIEALGELTRYQLKKNSIEVCGVTGSTGKSTVCELTARVLRSRFPTFKGLTDRSTPISVPRMLLNANLRNFDKVVVEMPMDGLGQIRELCSIAPPTYSVVLNVNDSHIEQLGSIEAITFAKLTKSR